MGTIRPLLNRVVVISSYRKHGNGAIGAKHAKNPNAPNDCGRRNATGKRGLIYQKENDGTLTELKACEGATFAHVSKQLRSTGLIPTWVAIKEKGETHF